MFIPPTPLSVSKIRAFILAAGSDGDLHPHLGVASEFAARGHEVLFLTTFDYLDLARSCGFEAVSIIAEREKDEFESARGLNPVGRVRSRCNFFAHKVSAICELVAARLDERSILISPPFACPVAKLLHLRYGVPYVSTVLSPASLCSLRNPPAFKSGEWFSRLPQPARRILFRSAESLIIDPGFRWLLGDLLRTMQVPAPHRVMSEWSWSPLRILGLFADWFCPASQDWPPQLVLTGFPLFHPHADDEDLSPGLRGFLGAGPAPVVFTAGTEAKTVRNFFDIARRTAQSLGLRAVFLSRLGDQLPSLPDTIHYETYASLRLLLPRSAGIVHHGGIGTTAEAMRAGIPQLILPGRLDQFDNARHVERLGCGLVEKNCFDSAAATDKLRQLLRSPEVAQACRPLRDRVAPGARACSRAADVIEEVWLSAHLAHLAPPSSRRMAS
jgi:rhamnosyltransferase subunit B